MKICNLKGMMIMDKIELSKHEKQGDTFYTPFTSPSGLGAKLSLFQLGKVLVAGISLDWFNYP